MLKAFKAACRRVKLVVAICLFIIEYGILKVHGKVWKYMTSNNTTSDDTIIHCIQFYFSVILLIICDAFHLFNYFIFYVTGEIVHICIFRLHNKLRNSKRFLITRLCA